jgi:hypothetical protein
MAMNPNVLLSEQAKLVTGLAPIVPAGSTPAYVTMKNYPKCTVVILVANGTTVTGSAIAMKQATAVAGSGVKALPFTNVRANLDCAASDALVDTAVVSNTFTTATTNSKNLMYEITVDQSALDMANNFDCIRADTGNATNATVSVLYILWPAEYGKSTPTSAVID